MYLYNEYFGGWGGGHHGDQGRGGDIVLVTAEKPYFLDKDNYYPLMVYNWSHILAFIVEYNVHELYILSFIHFNP